MKLLLASGSPRRRQLLSELQYPVSFLSLDIDEQITESVQVFDIAETLARRKAAAYSGCLLKDDTVLITADTVVVHNGRAMGKPRNHDEAVAMLKDLSDSKHTVYTGVCLRSNSQTFSFTESTDVYFRILSDEDIQYYVDNYKPYDKAGAYGIQEWIGLIGVSRIDGCYYNVMGLPVARLYEILNSRFLSK